MFTAKDYAMPQSVEEAYEILTARKTNYIVAGCAWLRMGSRRINTAVDLFLIGLALSSLRDGGLPETAPAVCRNRSAAFRRVRWENGELILSLRPRQG